MLCATITIFLKLWPRLAFPDRICLDLPISMPKEIIYESPGDDEPESLSTRRVIRILQAWLQIAIFESLSRGMVDDKL